jgi:hypothetical protein
MDTKLIYKTAILFSDIRMNAAMNKNINISDLHKIQLRLNEEAPGFSKNILLYCCDILQLLIKQEDFKKIYDFADAVHNLPSCFDNTSYFKFNNDFWDLYIEPFRKEYGNEYFKEFNPDFTKTLNKK